MPAPLTQMAREIAEQPAALAATFEHVLPLRHDITRLAAGRRHVIFVARGSSDNASVYGRYLTEIHAGRQASLAAPSVATLYGANLDLSNSLVVAVSQSGATQEIVDTAEWAKRNGAAVVGITNDGNSPLASTADVALITRAGRELAVPATKTYTTQLAAITVAVDALAPKPSTQTSPGSRMPPRRCWRARSMQQPTCCPAPTTYCPAAAASPSARRSRWLSSWRRPVCSRCGGCPTPT
jgi:glucosamine--fructose-6-phosphate aminotransferase (isomerizing)